MSGTQAKASPSDIRISNITAAFEQLFPATQMSRANIGKLIGLSRFTTSEVTGEMVDNRILRELGPDNREGRGKRSQVLAIDTDFWRIVSVDLSNPMLVKGALADLSGRIVDRTELPVDHGCSVNDVIDLCRQLISSTPLPTLGIGIAVTGIVEPNGVVRKSVHLGWSELPLKTEVENATGVPVIVGNDTNAALVAERFFGDCSPNSMLISIGRGVGAALCLNDAIIEGSSFTAGEIAHVVVDPNGPICECGKQGCLESFVSGDRLQQRISQDPAARTHILTEAGALLGRVMAIPAGLLDLRDISVYGAPEIVNTQFIDAMENEISRTVTTDYQEAPQIHRCRQGEDLTLRGPGHHRDPHTGADDSRTRLPHRRSIAPDALARTKTSSRWKKLPANRPANVQNPPATGRIAPSATLRASIFLQSLEESGPQNTPVLSKNLQ